MIGLYKSGLRNCVATLGTAFTKHHFNKIKRYTNKIIFCFDGDAAGKSAAWKAITNCLPELKDEIQLSLVFLPEGCDPDSYVKTDRENFDNFTKLIQNFFNKKKIKICDLDRIYVNLGPGKFTSLRISLSIAKAISFANNISFI